MNWCREKVNKILKKQEPALGIMQQSDWDDFKTYRVACDCMDPGHDHHVSVEYDKECRLVSVHIGTTATTPFWSMSRWKQIWQIISQGHITCEAVIIMNQQQALNYAKALEYSIGKVSKIEKE